MTRRWPWGSQIEVKKYYMIGVPLNAYIKVKEEAYKLIRGRKEPVQIHMITVKAHSSSTYAKFSEKLQFLFS